MTDPARKPKPPAEPHPKESILPSEGLLLGGLLDAVEEIVSIKDPAGLYRSCNQGFRNLVGKPVADILLRSDRDLFPTVTAFQNTQRDREVTKSSRAVRFEQVLVRPDGSEVLLSTQKVPLLDGQGKITGILTVSQDITDQREEEIIHETERRMAMLLAQRVTLSEALPLCLDFAMQVADMDSGGIYLVDRKTGALQLTTKVGLSDQTIPLNDTALPDSPRHTLVMQGKPVYQTFPMIREAGKTQYLAEGLRCLAVIPLIANDRVIACLNLASHRHDEVPRFRQEALERLSQQVGNVIARFEVQEDLKESRDELQSMFDSLQDLIFVLDTQGRLLLVNRRVIDRLGYTWEDLQGRSVEMVHPPEQRQEALRIVGEMLAGKRSMCPISLYCKDGSLVPVETVVTPGRWGSRDVLIGISRDISERKAAEEERLRQNRMLEYRHQFEALLTATSTQFINLPSERIDPAVQEVLKTVGEFEQVDRSYLFRLDSARETMSNTHEWCGPGIEPAISMLQDLPQEMFPWWIKRLRQNEEVYIPEVSQLPDEAAAERSILQEQGIRSVLVVPIHLNNQLDGFLGFDSVLHAREWSEDSILLIRMVGDILANALSRQQMERDLQLSEARNRALLNAVPDQIIRMDLAGVVLDYRPSRTELPDTPPGNVIGHHVRKILPGDLADRAIRCAQNVLESGQMQTLEYTQKMRGSTFSFEARFTQSGNREVTVIIRDISERVRLEQMKSDFINRATHELRTPVATMMLMQELIDGQPSPDEQREYWGILKAELQRERYLVEDLLSAARLENDRTVMRLSTFKIADCLEQVVEQAEVIARRKGIELSCETFFQEGMEGSGTITADEGALKQVFNNLIGNAVKFTPAGGTVSIHLREKENGYELTFRDNGIGIPSEDLPLLFTRFFRGSNAILEEVSGTGIGLYITHGIVEKHRGKIRVSSTLGKGTEFRLWLPRDQKK